MFARCCTAFAVLFLMTWAVSLTIILCYFSMTVLLRMGGF